MQPWSWLRKPSPKRDIQRKLWSAWMWQHLNSIGRANTIWTSSHPMTQSLPSLLMNWLISTRALWRIIQVTSWLTHFYTSFKHLKGQNIESSHTNVDKNAVLFWITESLTPIKLPFKYSLILHWNCDNNQISLILSVWFVYLQSSDLQVMKL